MPRLGSRVRVPSSARFQKASLFLGIAGLFIFLPFAFATRMHIFVKFALVHIKEDLQSLFGCNVDIVLLRDHMDSFLKNCIEKEGIYV